MSAILTIIISTLNEGILNCINVVRYKNDQVNYLIVHQNHNETKIPEELNREDINIITTKTKGLSKSRNIGIENCKTPFALISDDDVSYIEEGMNEVLDRIKNADFQIATFKIRTKQDEPEYKQYPTESYLMNTEFKHWVSSIEILINVEKFKNKKIKFDERFGLGSLLKKGEEQILLVDAIAKGLIVKYFPIYIVNHPFESSGKRKTSEKFLFFYKGAYDQRINKRTKLSDLLALKFNLLRKLKVISCYYLGIFYVQLF